MEKQIHLSYQDARAIVSAVAEQIESRGQGAAVAVVDEHGELMAFLRTDGCPLPAIDNAINKAYTAARERQTSWEVGQRSRVEEFPLTHFGNLRYTGCGGGAPIVYNGQVIGAVGVSGLEENEDMELANYGASVAC